MRFSVNDMRKKWFYAGKVENQVPFYIGYKEDMF